MKKLIPVLFLLINLLPFSFSASGGTTEDTDPPRLAATYPRSWGILSSLDSLSVTFSEAVNEVNGKTIVIFEVGSQAPVSTVTLPSPDVTGSGTTTISISLGATLVSGHYYVEIQEGAFKDAAGNAFTGITDAQAWKFSIYEVGVIDQNTSWSDSVAIYTDITLYSALDIAPGTRVRFMGHYMMEVWSSLSVAGEEEDSIYFFADDPSTGWKGLRMNGLGTFSYCRFTDGNALDGSNDEGFGGAIYANQLPELLIEHCLFEGNHADVLGGAIYCYLSTPEIRNSIFRNNSANEGGAIVLDYKSDAVLENNLVVNNTGTTRGGGMMIVEESEAIVYNNTFSGNLAGQGGAVSCVMGSTADFYNCIFYEDVADTTGDEISLVLASYPQGQPDFYYCLLDGGTAAIDGTFTGDFLSCLDTDPLFYQAGDEPFRTWKTSPCVNAGDPATTISDVGEDDLSGRPRILSHRIDMGAYETDLEVDGFPGTALKFNPDSYVDLGNDASLNLSRAATVEAWIRADSVAANCSMLSKGNVHWLYWDAELEDTPGHGLQIFLPGPNTGWWEFHYPMNYDKWYHVAVTFEESGQLVAYVNGEVARTGNFPGAVDINTNVFYLGHARAGDDYEGLMDEIRLWNTVRSRQEIREDMYLTVPFTSPGLVSYWQCNAGSGPFLEDVVGPNKGTLHNMTDSSWVNSTIPFGDGISVTNEVSSAGDVIFAGADLEMDAYQKTLTDTLTLTKIDNLPNIVPLGSAKVLDKHYWVLNSFGDGQYAANLAFISSGGILPINETMPSGLMLFQRENTGDMEWDLLKRATAASFQDQTVTFDSISAYGQFCIAKNELDPVPGNALQFNGDGGYLALDHPEHFDFDTAFTIETWFMIDSVPDDYYTIFSKGDAWALEMFYASDVIVFEFGINNDNLIAVSQVDPSVIKDKWTHISCVYQNGPAGSYILTYINGEPGIQSPAEPLTASGSPITIGSDFKGQLDEMRIWGLARSEQQIRRNMHLAVTLPVQGLLTYLQFNEATGTRAWDLIGDNDGTLVEVVAPVHRTTSTLPFGGGQSDTQQEQAGPVMFTGTGLLMDFNMQYGASITASKIETPPVTRPDDIPDLFDNQYWVLHRYGNGHYDANLSFTVDEQLSQSDALNPQHIKLFHRQATSGQAWTLCDSASYVDPASQTITFNSITDTGQFIIGRNKHFSGLPGYALHFDGENDAVSGSGLDTSLNAFTIEAWVRHDALPGDVQRYITLEPEVAVLRYDGTSYGGNNELHFYVKKANGSLADIRVDNVLSAGEWLHVAGTYDGDSMKLYLNGKVLEGKKVDGGLYTPDGSYKLGSGGETMDGLLDEIRIWNNVRTETQIREGMHRVITNSEPGLVNYWQFNEGSGSTATDTVNDISANLVNMDQENCWTLSTIPAGVGSSASEIISRPGTEEFNATGTQMDFTAKSGVDSVTVTRIKLTPNSLPPGNYTVLDDQYWVINSFGTGKFATDLVFTPLESLEPSDIIYPYSLKLFSRPSRSDGSWDLVDSAYVVNYRDNSISFKGISHFSQFIIARNPLPDKLDNNALYFDGNDDYLAVEADTSLNVYQFTVEYWIKSSDPGDQTGIIDKGYGTQSNWYFLSSTSPYTRGVTFGLYSEGYTGELINSWEDDNWHHVAGTYNGITLTLYIDGVAVSSTNTPGMIVSSQNITIGCRRDGTNYFQGDLDELRVWKYCRTQEEIREDMHHELQGTEANLVAYWQFNEYSGDVAVDLKGHNNGHLLNMTESNRISTTAPIPFFTVKAGNWEDPGTWADGQTIPNYYWSRIQLNHSDTVNSSFHVWEIQVKEGASLIFSPGNLMTIDGE